MDAPGHRCVDPYLTPPGTQPLPGKGTARNGRTSEYHAGALLRLLLRLSFADAIDPHSYARPSLGALGIDVSPRAIETAHTKATERGIDASFRVLDAPHLDTLGRTFDTVLDSGLFHVFDDTTRTQYVTAVHAAFSPGWRIESLAPDHFDINPGTRHPHRRSLARGCRPASAPVRAFRRRHLRADSPADC
jgi:hypothetical protein